MTRSFIREYCTVIAVVLGITLITWLPFLLKAHTFLGVPTGQRCVGMSCVFQNFDGPYYIVVAKTFYNRVVFERLQFEIPLQFEYFAAHLPGYPLLIVLFAHVSPYPVAMLLATLTGNILLGCVFYALLKLFRITQQPLIATIVLLLVSKFVIVNAIGAPESLFVAAILGSLLLYEKKQYVLAGLLGALAVSIKLPGILVSVAYLGVFLESWVRAKKPSLTTLPAILFPLIGLWGVFAFYQHQMGDFFAFFHTNATVPMPYPFSVFNYTAKWVDMPWLEHVVFIAFIYIGALFLLWERKERSFFWFPAVFIVATLFVQHKDISRYILPAWPLVVIAYHKVWEDKRFQLLLLVLLPALFMYAWNFIAYNVAPISDWKSLL